MIDPLALAQAYKSLFGVARQTYAAVHTTARATIEERAYWDSAPPRRSDPDAQDPEFELLDERDALPRCQVVDWPEALRDSRLAYFLDGAQRSQLLFVADTVPVVVTASAVTILRRRTPGAQLEPFKTPWIEPPTVLLPRSELTEPLWRACLDTGLPVADTCASVRAIALGNPETITASFDLCRALAHEQASSLRQELERTAIQNWLAHRRRELLVVDGEIRYLGPAAAEGSLIGVIKSHQHRFTGERLTNILHLPAYYRTHRFASRPMPGGGGPLTASFYLRWRQAPRGADPGFGLLRVETGLDVGIVETDTIAAWLIAEARPSVPSERSGNHLYPIARAERSAKRAVAEVWRSLPRLVFNS